MNSKCSIVEKFVIERRSNILDGAASPGRIRLASLPSRLSDSIMLNSAKRNLRRSAFFGLQEDMRRSQELFERTFGMRFDARLDASDDARQKTRPRTDATAYSDAARRKVAEVNGLDVELYQYAKELFEERYRKVNGDYDDDRN